MKLTAKYKYGETEGYASLTADRLAEREGMVYVYNRAELVGIFDVGCLTMVYLTESGK